MGHELSSMVLAELLDGASSGIPTSVSSIAVSALVGIAGISSRVTDSFSRSRRNARHLR